MRQEAVKRVLQNKIIRTQVEMKNKYECESK